MKPRYRWSWKWTAWKLKLCPGGNDRNCPGWLVPPRRWERA